MAPAPGFRSDVSDLPAWDPRRADSSEPKEHDQEDDELDPVEVGIITHV
jgi:hypothetical protein